MLLGSSSSKSIFLVEVQSFAQKAVFCLACLSFFLRREKEKKTASLLKKICRKVSKSEAGGLEEIQSEIRFCWPLQMIMRPSTIYGPDSLLFRAAVVVLAQIFLGIP